MGKKILVFFIRLGIAITALLLFFIGSVYIGIFGPIPNNQELQNIKQSQASIVYSSDKEIIGKIYYTNRTNVPYKKLPKNLINALIATEDVRFYEHKGIDKIALLRVLIKSIILRNNSAGGGSTLSQQLAKNLYHRKSYSFLTMPVNKTKEAILAYRLESLYSKEEILALYFNTVPFGERVYGIESASQRFFSKHTQDLNLEQAAILVGILKANSYYNPKRHPDHAFRRRNVVLKQMMKAGFISDLTYKKIANKPINTNYTNLQLENPNGYYLSIVRKKADAILENIQKPDGTNWNIKTDGLMIETTLVSELQNQALTARKEHLKRLQKKMDIHWSQIKNRTTVQKIVNKEWQQSNTYKALVKANRKKSEIQEQFTQRKKTSVFNWNNKSYNYAPKDSIEHYLKMLHCGVYGIDSNTGAVKIYVGGNNYEHLPYNLIKSERQAASTFKPIVYTAALEQGEKPCDWINNEEKIYTNYDNWTPKNYDHSNGGYFSMKGALAKSANIPTVVTYFKVGNANLQKTATTLGLEKNIEKNPTVALGTSTYSLENLVNSYVPFSNKKHKVVPYYIKSIKTASGKTIYQHKPNRYKKLELKSNTLETMQYLLKNVVENGTAKSLKAKYGAKGEWAGKTGTSQDYSDSWFIGFNKNLVIGTWVGCKYPSINLPRSIGGGSVAALPIVGHIVSKNYTSTTNQQLSSNFSFGLETVKNCDCEFFREENTVEKILDVFDKKEKKAKKEEKAKKKKRNFFKWLFGKKKKE
ncbi:transglycosylase domain-containing protein [Wenyingzhuangia sp. IMCC45574]